MLRRWPVPAQRSAGGDSPARALRRGGEAVARPRAGASAPQLSGAGTPDVRVLDAADGDLPKVAVPVVHVADAHLRRGAPPAGPEQAAVGRHAAASGALAARQSRPPSGRRTAPRLLAARTSFGSHQPGAEGSRTMGDRRPRTRPRCAAPTTAGPSAVCSSSSRRLGYVSCETRFSEPAAASSCAAPTRTASPGRRASESRARGAGGRRSSRLREREALRRGARGVVLVAGPATRPSCPAVTGVDMGRLVKRSGALRGARASRPHGRARPGADRASDHVRRARPAAEQPARRPPIAMRARRFEASRTDGDLLPGRRLRRAWAACILAAGACQVAASAESRRRRARPTMRR